MQNLKEVIPYGDCDTELEIFSYCPNWCNEIDKQYIANNMLDVKSEKL